MACRTCGSAIGHCGWGLLALAWNNTLVPFGALPGSTSCQPTGKPSMRRRSGLVILVGAGAPVRLAGVGAACSVS